MSISLIRLKTLLWYISATSWYCCSSIWSFSNISFKKKRKNFSVGLSHKWWKILTLTESKNALNSFSSLQVAWQCEPSYTKVGLLFAFQFVVVSFKIFAKWLWKSESHLATRQSPGSASGLFPNCNLNISVTMSAIGKSAGFSLFKVDSTTPSLEKKILVLWRKILRTQYFADCFSFSQEARIFWERKKLYSAFIKRFYKESERGK